MRDHRRGTAGRDERGIGADRSGPLRAGLAYFGFVFAAGFVLGTVRELVVTPAMGERAAELLETPVMLAVAWLAARWVVRRFRVPPGAGARLAVGFIGLALLLSAELLVVLELRGVSLDAYVAGRDPVSGAVYLASLGVFALFPWLAGRRAGS